MAVGSATSSGPSPATSMLGVDTLFYAADDAARQTIKGLGENESGTSEGDKKKIMGENGDGVGGPPVDNATYQRMMSQGAQVG